VRSDLLQARLNALAAVVEIDRLAGSYLSILPTETAAAIKTGDPDTEFAFQPMTDELP
jgi:hypothetical protein